jgi:serine/threonine protein phosphatase PrpC
MVAVAALDDEWRWAHIGDSLLLHFHDGALSLLNMQHESWDGTLTRWLGYPFHQSPDHGSLPRVGKLILATDGVQLRDVDDFDGAWRWMEAALLDGANAHELVQRSLDHGSTDNIAVVVMS